MKEYRPPMVIKEVPWAVATEIRAPEACKSFLLIESGALECGRGSMQTCSLLTIATSRGYPP